ncbi:DDB1- and CUL4-associated factor 11 [Cochliomyia hominivorax]
MGNNITYELEDFDNYLSDDSSLSFDNADHLSLAYSMVLSEIVREDINDMAPVIRKKPDLRIFRHTMMYKEIKALSGFPANSKKPNERWCIAKGLMKRENGLTVCKNGSFSSNQQRRIANYFVPNKKVDRLMALDSKVYICKFKDDGSRLITATQDGMVRIFDASKGTYHRLQRVKARDVNWSILDIDFSPCGRYFTYSTWRSAFNVTPIEGDYYEIYNIGSDRNHSGMFSVRFSPCGHKLIAGLTDCIAICDRESRHISTIRTENAFSVDVNAISYVSDMDPNLIVSGCHNGIIKLWDLRCSSSSSSPRFTKASSVFLGHLDSVTYIDPRNDGHYILSNSKDQSIKIWDLRQPTPKNKVRTNPNTPLIDWDYRVNQVPREYYNPTKVLDGDVSVMTYRGHRVTKTLLRAKFSPAAQTGQRYIYTGCSTGRIIIYDVLTGHIKEAIESHRHVIRDLHWHPVRSEIVSGSWDFQVNLNSYKNKPNLKRSNSELIEKPLRRSRRIAHRKGELDAEDDEEDDENDF